jgi:hypothetical protein
LIWIKKEERHVSLFRNPLIHPVTFEILPSTDGCCPRIEQKKNEKNLQLDTNQFLLFKYGCVNVGLGLFERDKKCFLLCQNQLSMLQYSLFSWYDLCKFWEKKYYASICRWKKYVPTKFHLVDLIKIAHPILYSFITDISDRKDLLFLLDFPPLPPFREEKLAP